MASAVELKRNKTRQDMKTKRKRQERTRLKENIFWSPSFLIFLRSFSFCLSRYIVLRWVFFRLPFLDVFLCVVYRIVTSCFLYLLSISFRLTSSCYFSSSAKPFTQHSSPFLPDDRFLCASLYVADIMVDSTIFLYLSFGFLKARIWNFFARRKKWSKRWESCFCGNTFDRQLELKLTICDPLERIFINVIEVS